MIAVEALEDAQALTVAGYLTSWLAHTRGRVRATTYEGYEGLIRIHALPRLGEVPLARLSPLHIQRVYAPSARRRHTHRRNRDRRGAVRRAG